LSDKHYSGFVNIIGKPNVGKSTLMNAFMGEKFSIITNKPQTTRHRIIGLWNDEEYQIVFSDTPGMIESPGYRMQKEMNKFAYSSFEDADVLLFVTEKNDGYDGTEKVFSLLNEVSVPKILVINKIDVTDDDLVAEMEKYYTDLVQFDEVRKISAIEKRGTEELFSTIKTHLPEGPAYYPKDQLTDRPERFFVSEIIRENILELYKEEIPYSCEVEIEEFKESEKRGEPFVHIFANIYVSRKSQKSIIIGKGGQSIKQLGIDSRKGIETFLEKRIHLELYVRVKEKWRNDDRSLKSFGYLK